MKRHVIETKAMTIGFSFCRHNKLRRHTTKKWLSSFKRVLHCIRIIIPPASCLLFNWILSGVQPMQFIEIQVQIHLFKLEVWTW